jgi:acyl-CoA reductase-like NAD-dependent aldehyde dehydrogenase
MAVLELKTATADVSHSDIFVGGEWRAPQSTARLDVFNPSTGRVFGHTPLCSAADVNSAVAAARAAFQSGIWADADPAARADVIERFADILERDADQIARLVALEGGFPLTVASALHVAMPIGFLRYYAQLIRNFAFEELRTETPNAQAYVRHVPAGVAGLIIPWNGPLILSLGKIAPALAAGCSIVFKPSPETPLSAYRIAAAAQEAGVPPGVFNMLPADVEGSERLCNHPDVDLISFTGSTATGRLIGAACAQQFKRCLLELGGNAAAIVLDDAPLDQLAEGLATHSFLMNSGQACIMQRRVLAPRSRYHEVVEALSAVAKAVQVGDALSPDTMVGPMISAAHQSRVLDYIDAGQREGARIAAGGGRPDGRDDGYFVAPTVLADVDNAMRPAREEIFGPVACVIAYADEEQALRMAADTEYGLSGSVWTGDPERGAAIGRRMRVGSVYINDSLQLHPAVPFGGFGASGIGRECGPEGFAEYCETQSLWIPR